MNAQSSLDSLRISLRNRDGALFTCLTKEEEVNKQSKNLTIFSTLVLYLKLRGGLSAIVSFRLSSRPKFPNAEETNGGRTPLSSIGKLLIAQLALLLLLLLLYFACIFSSNFKQIFLIKC